ncbi:helix-turn-helix domain-containing protein [Catellatospora tritici]|uniref:helix-turn-helix domain-containing protein n=1 Tax=Catellatospora tritici TaxID=2851566 RepID=UPI001C2DAB4C|nr:helix-turn-helix domain-containing protein [Catellatospora tritici]MBV1854897.1 helix-turn-helix domain-containing protein [Catellatospora tritici]
MSDVAGAVVVQAYRFALDPSPAQDRDLYRHAGAGRFAFNWALATVRANLGQRAAERTYGLTGPQLTPALGWTLPALRRAWNAAKPQVAPWVGAVLERGVQHRIGRSGAGVGQLVGLAQWPPRRAQGRVSPVSVAAAGGAVGAVHHRHDPGRGQPPPCDPAEVGSDPYP